MEMPEGSPVRKIPTFHLPYGIEADVGIILHDAARHTDCASSFCAISMSPGLIPDAHRPGDPAATHDKGRLRPQSANVETGGVRRIIPPDGTCIRDYIHVSDLVRTFFVACLPATAAPAQRSTAVTTRRFSI
jgi:hypothetical protein